MTQSCATNNSIAIQYTGFFRRVCFRQRRHPLVWTEQKQRTLQCIPGGQMSVISRFYQLLRARLSYHLKTKTSNKQIRAGNGNKRCCSTTTGLTRYTIERIQASAISGHCAVPASEQKHARLLVVKLISRAHFNRFLLFCPILLLLLLLWC